MSTYLVAFVVCDYNHTDTKTSKNISVSVYAPTDLLPQASFALSTATKILEHYEDFFGVPYPLPKQGEKLFSSVQTLWIIKSVQRET